MLYLLYIMYFALVSFSYLFLGAMYVFIFHMLQDQRDDWDNIIWLFWPIMAWRRWRLHRFLHHMNKKWK